jgi:hypothetical protein
MLNPHREKKNKEKVEEKNKECLYIFTVSILF